MLRNTLLCKKINKDTKEIKDILKQNPYTKGIADSLVEYKSKRYLSQDVDYYINEKTLAPSILCSRLFPLGAALLTGIGVLGTFVGLLLGLDGLETSKGTAATLLAINQVTKGASVAFATSVTGVFFSLLLNLIEKSVSSCMAVCVRHIQEDLSYNFPPFPVMDVFKDTGQNSEQSAKLLVLGDLAERIGEKMQESMDSFLQSMFGKMSETMSASGDKIAKAVACSLDDSLREKLVPAVDRISDAAVDLSERQAHSSEDALKSVVGQFMEKFGEQGEAQRKAMLDATKQFQQSSSSLSSSMDKIMLQMKEQQNTLTDRQQEHMEELSRSFLEMSAEQGKNIELAGQEMRTRLGSFSDKMAEEFECQTASLRDVTDNIHNSLSSVVENAKGIFDRNAGLMKDTLGSVNTLLAQGKDLQFYLNETKDSFKEVSGAIQQSSNDLVAAGGSLERFGNDITQSVEKTTSLYMALEKQFRSAKESLDDVLDDLDDLKDKFAEVADRNSETVEKASENYKELEDSCRQLHDKLHEEVKEIGEAARKQVQELQESMSKWLDEYGQQVNAQVADRMSEWNRQTEKFCHTMVAATDGYAEAVGAISEVVDKIREK